MRTREQGGRDEIKQRRRNAAESETEEAKEASERRMAWMARDG